MAKKLKEVRKIADKPHFSKEPYFVAGGGAGADGKSLEFTWDGTRLGIRVEGDEEYEFVDLQGPPGPEGSAGVDGQDGRGIDDITYDSDTNEFVFHMSDNTEIRVAVPAVE